MIGVFDSGIGGLSVLKALRAELPHEGFIYIADSAHAPYGEAEYPLLPIIGVEPALKPAVALSKTDHIAVMATRSTLASARFQALMATQKGLARFTVVPCDGLADAIERSADTGNATETIAACDRITCSAGHFGIQKGNIDTLALGCTHYPFVATYRRTLVGPDVQLVDNGEAVAHQTRRRLEQAGALHTSPAPAEMANIRLFSTGRTQALQAAAQYWPKLKASSKSLYF